MAQGADKSRREGRIVFTVTVNRSMQIIFPSNAIGPEDRKVREKDGRKRDINWKRKKAALGPWHEQMYHDLCVHQ